jgi:hypothetical protein
MRWSQLLPNGVRRAATDLRCYAHLVPRHALTLTACACVAISVASCGLFSSFSGASTPSPDGGPVSADDAGASGSDATTIDATFDSGVTTIFREGYEDGGCSNATGEYLALLSTSTIAHTGSNSCEVCWSDGTVVSDTTYAIDQLLPTPPPPGGTHAHAEAWVRAVDNAPVAQQCSLSLRARDSSMKQIQDTPGNAAELTSTWTKIVVDMTLAPDAAAWDYYAGTALLSGGTLANGDCFLIDDALVTITP